MVQPQIIDASVAIKWFVHEHDSSLALQILSEIQQNPSKYLVPELFFNEILSVLCRTMPSVQQVCEALECIEELGLERIGNGHDLLQLAAKFSKEYDLSAYDSIYVSMAKTVNGIWITADEKAHKKIVSLNLSRTLSHGKA